MALQVALGARQSWAMCYIAHAFINWTKGGLKVSTKSLAVAQSLLERCREAGDQFVTPMQLIKMVYIAHGYMLGARGRPLIDEPIEAWQYGPVVPSLYRSLKQFRSNAVSVVPGASPCEFDEDEQKVLDVVAKRYARYSAVALSAATHRPGSPWSITWEAAGKNATISNDLIEGFYKRLLQSASHSAL